MTCIRSLVKQTPTTGGYTYGSYRFPCKKLTCVEPSCIEQRTKETVDRYFHAFGNLPDVKPKILTVAQVVKDYVLSIQGINLKPLTVAEVLEWNKNRIQKFNQNRMIISLSHIHRLRINRAGLQEMSPPLYGKLNRWRNPMKTYIDYHFNLLAKNFGVCSHF